MPFFTAGRMGKKRVKATCVLKIISRIAREELGNEEAEGEVQATSDSSLAQLLMQSKEKS